MTVVVVHDVVCMTVVVVHDVVRAQCWAPPREIARLFYNRLVSNDPFLWPDEKIRRRLCETGAAHLDLTGEEGRKLNIKFPGRPQDPLYQFYLQQLHN